MPIPANIPIIRTWSNLQLRWTIYKENTDTPEDFFGATVKMFLVTPYAQKLVHPTIEGNVLSLTIAGNQLKKEEVYDLKLVWTKNNGKTWASKAKNYAFMVNDDAEYTPHTGWVEIESIAIGIGYDGLSAYDYAVIGGYEGTEESFYSQLAAISPDLSDLIQKPTTPYQAGDFPAFTAAGNVYAGLKISSDIATYTQCAIGDYGNYAGCLIIPLLKREITDRRDFNSFDKNDFIPLYAGDIVRINIKEVYTPSGVLLDNNNSAAWQFKNVVALWYDPISDTVQYRLLHCGHGMATANGRTELQIRDVYSCVFDIQFYVWNDAQDSTHRLLPYVQQNIITDRTFTDGSVAPTPLQNIVLTENTPEYVVSATNTHNITSVLNNAGEAGKVTVPDLGGDKTAFQFAISEESEAVLFRIWRKINGTVMMYEQLYEANHLLTLIWDLDSESWLVNAQSSADGGEDSGSNSNFDEIGI